MAIYGSGFLTRACIEKGLNHRCYQLLTLEEFADSFMVATSDRKDYLNDFVSITKKLTKIIDSCDDSKKIWVEIYDELVVPVVDLINSYRYEDAYNFGKDYIDKFKKEFLC